MMPKLALFVRLEAKPGKEAEDVADPRTVDRIVQEGLARFGRIDTLINNAGIFIAKPLVDYTEEGYASILATNLGGFFRITKRVAAVMLKQGSGHIGSTPLRPA
jgi:NAD(P)-dependent dehydrogenase (short-subunit alcohol dehydrogenase family)